MCSKQQLYALYIRSVCVDGNIVSDQTLMGVRILNLREERCGLQLRW
jgi:hypothetical protein